MAIIMIATAFFNAFQSFDYRTMQDLYHDDATFHDPVFQDLNSAEVKAMWEMLLTSGTDLKLRYEVIEESDTAATVKWIANYTFSQTKRKVENHVTTKMEFRDGKIYRQRDTFNLWKWSRMAIGAAGVTLGWTPIVKGKIRKTAGGNLKKFMAKNNK